jgi:hypothetical protein
VRWAEAHGDEWKALCRDIVLTRVKLDALEQNAQAMIEKCPDVAAVILPMVNWIGCRTIVEMSIEDLVKMATEAGVVSSGEIKTAKS